MIFHTVVYLFLIRLNNTLSHVKLIHLIMLCFHCGPELKKMLLLKNVQKDLHHMFLILKIHISSMMKHVFYSFFLLFISYSVDNQVGMRRFLNFFLVLFFEITRYLFFLLLIEFWCSIYWIFQVTQMYQTWYFSIDLQKYELSLKRKSNIFGLKFCFSEWCISQWTLTYSKSTIVNNKDARMTSIMAWFNFNTFTKDVCCFHYVI